MPTRSVWDEEVQERVKIPVDETDSAEVVGSNPTGPTTKRVQVLITRACVHPVDLRDAALKRFPWGILA